MREEYNSSVKNIAGNVSFFQEKFWHIEIFDYRIK